MQTFSKSQGGNDGWDHTMFLAEPQSARLLLELVRNPNFVNCRREQQSFAKKSVEGIGGEQGGANEMVGFATVEYVSLLVEERADLGYEAGVGG